MAEGDGGEDFSKKVERAAVLLVVVVVVVLVEIAAAEVVGGRSGAVEEMTSGAGNGHVRGIRRIRPGVIPFAGNGCAFRTHPADVILRLTTQSSRHEHAVASRRICGRSAPKNRR